VRAKGYNEFVSKWGKRANMDNWRRKNSVDAALKNISANLDIDNPPPVDSTGKDQAGLVPGSYDALMADLPLSKEQLDSSNEKLAAAYMELARIFQNELLDYPEAIYEYEQYLDHFDAHPGIPEALMGLYFCYTKLGMTADAEKYKRKLSQGYAGSDYEKKVNDPKSMLSQGQKDSKETSRYEQIYNLFLEGKFNEALAAKQLANEEQGTGYWTPQLLYVEAVYYVKERNDSAAIRVLTDIITLFPESPMKAKAETMKDVVSRRAEIESYLTNLDVTRTAEERVMVPDSRPAALPTPKPQPQAIKKDEAPQIKPTLPVNRPQTAFDTVKVIPSMVKAGYVLQADKPHFVVMVLDKVDGVYINEVKNAFARLNRERSDSRSLVINRETLDADRSLMTFESFEDANAAIAYMDRLKKSAPSYISWLPAAKYSFLIITEDNLRYMRESKDIPTYRGLLSNQYPGKF
jgi:outer membrane protein assembly factor BamD (BamD/ComL family)